MWETAQGELSVLSPAARSPNLTVDAFVQNRVQQTVKSQEGSIMAYRIASLIHFYHVTMERTIGAEALMSTVLAE